MPWVLTILLVCCAPPPSVTSSRAQDAEQDYQKAYPRWRDAIEANPALDVAAWLRTDAGPLALRGAVEDLISFGPNLVPFLVREFRSETDQLRLYRLMFLLDHACCRCGDTASTRSHSSPRGSTSRIPPSPTLRS